jgi:hypothetical protein
VIGTISDRHFNFSAKDGCFVQDAIADQINASEWAHRRHHLHLGQNLLCLVRFYRGLLVIAAGTAFRAALAELLAAR